eukprot:snap_masked-scaffold_2-processed-gene-11.27-mRNA-1 protein AED:1.00 eAED:1.00 QI:0/0/0/0/1/1/3/0/397
MSLPEMLKDALTELDSMLEADFKPVDSWTRTERREYMNRAYKKHCYKLKEQELETFISCVSYDAEIRQLKKQQKTLSTMLETLQKVKEQNIISSTEKQLLNQNEILRQKAIKTQRQIYLLGKLNRLSCFFPVFDVSKFQQCVDLTLAKSLQMFIEHKVTKHGDISFMSKKYKAIKNRTKLRKELNKSLKIQKHWYGDIFLKSLVCDESQSLMFSHQVRVENVDFFEYTDAFYETMRYNKTDSGTLERCHNIEYDVSHLTARDIPFFSVFLQGKSLNFEAFNFSFHSPKKGDEYSDCVASSCFTAFYRNDNLAAIIKSGIYYDEKKKIFRPTLQSLFCTVISKHPKKKRTLIAKSVSSHVSGNIFGEWLSLYKENANYRKKQIFPLGKLYLLAFTKND